MNAKTFLTAQNLIEQLLHADNNGQLSGCNYSDVINAAYEIMKEQSGGADPVGPDLRETMRDRELRRVINEMSSIENQVEAVLQNPYLANHVSILYKSDGDSQSTWRTVVPTGFSNDRFYAKHKGKEKQYLFHRTEDLLVDSLDVGR